MTTRKQAQIHATNSNSARLNDVLASNMERASERLGEFGEQISHFAHDVADRSLRAGREAKAYARAHPARTFAIALAAGYVIAKLVQHSTKSG